MAITKNDVHQAMLELRDSNIDDSTGNLLKHLGRGSKTTIEKYRLEVLADERAPVGELPPEVLRLLGVAWAAQQRKWMDEAVAMSSARVALAEGKATKIEAELARESARAQRYELEAKNARQAAGMLKADNKKLQEQLDKRKSEIEQVKGQAALLESQLKQANKQLLKAGR